MNKSMFGLIMVGIGIPVMVYAGMVFFSFPGPYGNVLGIGKFNHTLIAIVALLFLIAGIISLVMASRDQRNTANRS